MACSPYRAQAIHSVDEAWTDIIDRIDGNWDEAIQHLKVLAKWRKTGPPPTIGPAATQKLAELAWLAFSEAALRATDNRFNEGEDDRVPCV